MTESQAERAAIARARRLYGPVVQAEAARQAIFAGQMSTALTTAQISWLADFRLQIDLDGDRDVFTAFVDSAPRREDVCQHRMAAARRSCIQVQAQLARDAGHGVISQHDFAATLVGLRRALDVLIAEHQTHNERSRQALGEFFAGPRRRRDPIREDADDLFDAALDDLPRDEQEGKA